MPDDRTHEDRTEPGRRALHGEMVHLRQRIADLEQDRHALRRQVRALIRRVDFLGKARR
jgi:hypothetical protein